MIATGRRQFTFRRQDCRGAGDQFPVVSDRLVAPEDHDRARPLAATRGPRREESYSRQRIQLAADQRKRFHVCPQITQISADLK